MHGRTGPQVEAAVFQYIEDHGMGLRFDGSGAVGIDEFSVYVRAVRAGDTVVSGARFETPGWHHYG